MHLARSIHLNYELTSDNLVSIICSSVEDTSCGERKSSSSLPLLMDCNYSNSINYIGGAGRGGGGGRV